MQFFAALFNSLFMESSENGMNTCRFFFRVDHSLSPEVGTISAFEKFIQVLYFIGLSGVESRRELFLICHHQFVSLLFYYI